MGRYVKVDRKVNDVWALLLYLIAASVYASIVVLKRNEIANIVPKVDLVYSAIVTALVVSAMLFNFVGFLYLPKFTIQVVCILFPILFFALSFVTLNPVLILISGIGCIISIVFYFWYVRGNIDFIAEMLVTVTDIILRNIAACMIAVLLFSILNSAFLYQLPIPKKDGGAEYWIHGVFGFMVVCWTFFNSQYALSVLVSGIFSLTVTKEDESESVSGKALRNTLYSLGSVCFGGFILAIITVAKKMVDDSRDSRSRREEERNIAIASLACLASCILGILGDIVSLFNEITFPYLAVHGTGYVASVKGAYSVITQNARYLISYSVFSRISGCNYTAFVVLLFLSAGLYFDEKSLAINSPALMGAVLVCVMGMITYMLSLSIFISGGLSVVYTPDLVKGNYPKLAQEIEKASPISS